MKLHRENVYTNKCLENEIVAENRNVFCGWSEKIRRKYCGVQRKCVG